MVDRQRVLTPVKEPGASEIAIVLAQSTGLINAITDAICRVRSVDNPRGNALKYLCGLLP